MDISSAFTNLLTLGGQGAITSSSKTVSDNYQTFLNLLMTQLKNQDPSAPLDTNQFTQQLVQYSQIEQQLQQNKNLDALVKLTSANAAIGMVGYVGKEVTLDGSTTALSNGAATWQLEVPANAAKATFVVKDAKGNEVHSETGSLAAGHTDFSWDGTTSTGSTAPAGSYTLSVTATDAAGKAVSVGISFGGIVDGVDMTGDAPKLLIGGKEYDISDVLTINTAG